MHQEIIRSHNQVIESEANGKRVDQYLSEIEPEFSRSYLQKLIKEEKVWINEKIVKSNYRLNIGDHLFYQIPTPTSLFVEAEEIPLDIVYEDSDLLLINKPKGMVVHPAPGHEKGTLVNALLAHCKDELSGINGVMRPGIVHRIDRDTTGLLVVCKNDKAHQILSMQLKEHSIKRTYHAIVHSPFNELFGTIDAPIGRHPIERKKMAINHKNGRSAITHYTLIENLSGQYAYISCSLETGRTHQIRVHMSSIHHPLLGDTIYGSKQNKFHLQGQCLHAKTLGFIHPTKDYYVEFEAPLPDYFTSLMKKL